MHKHLSGIFFICLYLLAQTWAVTAQDDDTTTYIVQRGDVLDVIAFEFDVAVDCIVVANDIEYRSRIFPGDVLTIPDDCPPYDGLAFVITPADGTEASTAIDPGVGGSGIQTTDTPAAQALIDSYTVQRGDNLTRIASSYEVNVACLARTNNINNPDLIFVGQTLFIYEGCQGADDEVTVVVDPVERRICFGDPNPLRTITDGTYTVRPGDTLDYIGCDLGLSTRCLINANPQLANPGRLSVGQVLNINFGCPAWDGPPGPDDLTPQG